MADVEKKPQRSSVKVITLEDMVTLGMEVRQGQDELVEELRNITQAVRALAEVTARGVTR